MERRQVLRGLMLGVPTAASAAAGAAYASAGRVREASETSLEALKSRVDALSERLDESEAASKKTVKVLIALTGLSLGFDVSSLL